MTLIQSGTTAPAPKPAPAALLRPMTLEPALVNYSSTVPNGANWAVATRITAGGAWTVSRLGVAVTATPSGNCALAAFHDGGDVPGVLIAQTAPVAASPIGSLIVPLPGPITLVQGDWLALVADNVTVWFGFCASPGGVTALPWRSRAWPVGSLVFASNPTGFLADVRHVAMWGEP